MTEFATLGEALDAHKIKQAGKASRKHFAIREQHKTVKPLKPEEMDAKYHRRCYRSGKTERKHRQRAAQG
jgi:hypothetical protein